MSNYLIIGASSGIGKALAEELSSAGHQVYGTYHQHPQSHSSISYFSFNALEDELSADDLPDSLDGLAYCPGSINLRPFARIKAEAFKSDFDLQVIGAIKVLQTALPLLKKSESASVVLFSTVAVQTGFPFHAQVAVSKGAVEGLTRSLAAEWAPKIRVNAIAPSLTQTPLASKLLSSEEKIQANAERHPLKKIGAAEDIAQMAAFLLSEKASWISGQVYQVDGGMSSIKA
ncbi:MAG: SDR family oxidoreductase [Bacteroidota bacterium]